MLEVDGLHAFYGKSHVLHGVSFTVGAGEIVALLGRNGSGRSTTARAVMGMVRAEGSVRWKGQPILGRPTHEIARRGLGYVPESRDVFPGLTVHQNLLLGQKGGKSARPGWWSFEAMYEMFPVLAERRHASAGVLSGGEQQMLALCRTLMGEPELVIVDEPTEGLAPAIVALVADCLRRLREGGVSVLLIEQKLAIALRISDRALVMGHGGIVFDGTPAQLLADAVTRTEWLEV
jgi:branched-chain amino acid transport system ATP-binding protein